MKRRASESGFTLLEILVASMLLAMLITILTMVFNSSSIAWSMGKAGVAEMDEVRNNMAAAGMLADNAVPRVDLGALDKWGYMVSPWKADGTLRRRAILKTMPNTSLRIEPMVDGFVYNKSELGPDKWNRAKAKRLWATFSPGSIRLSGKAKTHIVGVWSYGPDGHPNTGDDISTWPDVD